MTIFRSPSTWNGKVSKLIKSWKILKVRSTTLPRTLEFSQVFDASVGDRKHSSVSVELAATVATIAAGRAMCCNRTLCRMYKRTVETARICLDVLHPSATSVCSFQSTQTQSSVIFHPFLLLIPCFNGSSACCLRNCSYF